VTCVSCGVVCFCLCFVLFMFSRLVVRGLDLILLFWLFWFVYFSFVIVDCWLLFVLGFVLVVCWGGCFMCSYWLCFCCLSLMFVSVYAFIDG